MKIKPEHYKVLRHAIISAMTLPGAPCKKLYLEKGLTDMRYRWDILWFALDRGVLGRELFSEMRYLNDACIDTALRRLVNSAKNTC